MFEYKDARYYTDFFKNHPDFEIIDDFEISHEKNEKNLFVGHVEVIGTIHPLFIRVEIPFTFPHNKLMFRTKSLSGYPHLIHTGKIKHGDWFCLNTPFAETVEEQLYQEINRLKEWIKKQMTPGLPPVIEDPNVRQALAIANAYEWENPDEVNEFSAKARLTFIGEGFSSPSSFKERKGHFYSVKSPDNRIYAFSHQIKGTSYKLPYIIVPNFPGNVSVLDDFLRLKDFYEWDDEICHHLLPDSNYKSCKRLTSWCSDKYEIEYTEKAALNLIKKVIDNLSKDNPYLDKGGRIHSIMNQDKKASIAVIPSHKTLLLSELENIRKEVFKNGGIQFKPDPWNRPIGEEDEYDEEQAMIDEWVDYGQYEFHHFAIGFESNDKIRWLVLGTNPAAIKREQTCYDVIVKDVYIEKLTALELWRDLPQFISRKMFFGRGAFCDKLTQKRIALVGLGAIGSMVAEALAHGGVQSIGLWDSDIVEPGNICRSSFTLDNLGFDKVYGIAEKIESINPYIELKEIKQHGYWNGHLIGGPNYQKYSNGSFYDNVNYKSQEESIKELDGYDLIIDSSGSNELLHFLSYSVPEKEIVSLCITNHANELLCASNANGNPFEIRKAYLSRIEQDTKNFYAEGEGCYSPTFLAKYSDIAALVNLALRDIDSSYIKDEVPQSSIYAYCNSGILTDRIQTYKLAGYDIVLNVSEETILDAKEMELAIDGNLGYVLGCYSADGKQIMITHVVESSEAIDKLQDAYNTSHGIIDYIGDFTYSDADTDSTQDNAIDILASKASDPEINTNNPLLALKKKDGEISFYLFINNQLVPFR